MTTDMPASSARSPVDQQLSEFAHVIDTLGKSIRTHQVVMAQKGIALPAEISADLLDLNDRISMLSKVVDEYDKERLNLEALVDIGQVINSSLDSTNVLNEVMDTIIRITGAQRAFLVMPDKDEKMDMVVARNWEQESVEPEDYRISSTIVNRVLDSGEAILTTNATLDPRFDDQQSIIAYNLRSILCVPLKVKGKLTGVIYADNSIREGLFTEKDRRLLSAFANQAAVALENAMLFASIQNTLDEVTELKTLMEDVFASIASGVITTDAADEITLCNNAAAMILGISSEKLIGSPLHTTLSKLSSDLSSKVEEVKVGDKRFIGIEVHTQLESRGDVDLSFNISPLKSADQQTRGIAIVVEDQTERKRLEAQRRLFERMVSPAVIDQLDPDSLQLGGDRKRISTLFADIRGYTSFSESIDPEMLVSVLNKYLAIAAEAVLKEEGTIDKFQGDAIMAWFNAPIPQSEHELRAARAAMMIQRRVLTLHQEMPENFQLQFGIGIHVGEALLGLIGTQQRLDYTAIGDSVNTAKRLQENAKPGQILISTQVAEAIKGEVAVHPIPPLKVQGKEKSLELFEIIGME